MRISDRLTAPERPPSRRRAAGVVLVAVLAGAAIAGPEWRPGLAAGWLAGFVFLLSLCVGASIWLLIGAVTGGRWVPELAPALQGLAGRTWLVALTGTLFVMAGPLLYPWWSGVPSPRISWLTPPFFGLRTLAILVFWSGLGLLVRRSFSAPVAALALALHGVAVSVAAVDWLLSRDPAFVSTASGAELAVLQLGLALAAVAVARHRVSAVNGDLGGLMLACLLGVFYLAGMEYIVSWTGNLPEKASWYLQRQTGMAAVFLWISLVLGVAGPFVALLPARWRRSAPVLRGTGAAMLAGGLAHLLWLAAPGPAPAAVALMAAATLAGLAIMLPRGPGI